MALLVVLAMIAAACTQTEADPTTTVVRNSPEADPPVTVVRDSPEARAMIDAALGGTQAVQDFAIYLDLVLMPEEGGLESFYDDVRDEAMTGAGVPVELVDGNTLAPVNSLRGAVTDPDGVVLPTISLDFALLEASPALVEETHQTLSEVFETAGEPGLIEAFPPGSEGAPLLVQIATADYTQRRTHVGPGDLATIDLSFVDAISPGDRIASAHLFEQTLPGDPAAEAGLSALELFSYRWNLGLVTMLGDDLGVTVVVDDTASVAAGPTARVEPQGRLVSSEPEEASVALHDGRSVPLPLVGSREADTLPVVAESATRPDPEIDPEVAGKLMETVVKPFVVGNLVSAGFQQAELWMLEATRPIMDDRSVRAFKIGVSNCIAVTGRFNDDGVWLEAWAVGVVSGDPEGAFRMEPPEEGEWEEGEGECRPLAFVDRSEVAITFGLMAAAAVCVRFLEEVRALNNPSNANPDPPDEFEFVRPSDSLTPICDLRRLPRTAGLFGDVHFTTFDQLIIQNQAAGEFLVFDNEVATVQMRTEPWKDSDTVSVATAVAARIGEHTVSIHLDTETFIGETYIDGELAETDRGESVAVGGAALSWSGFSWMVVWPDGTQLKVFPDTTGLVVFVTSESRSVGMFGGDGDGVKENDRVTRSGVVMSPDRSPTFWEEHYDVYVDSWRITPEESLFYYGPGESTETYTIEGFPASYWEVSDLDPVVRDEAEAACVGGAITREDILEACVLDVAITGDLAFVYPAYLVEASIPPQAAPLGGSADSPPIPGTEDMLMVGDITFEFGAEHRFSEGTQDSVCMFDGQFSVFARTRFTAENGAELQFQFEYWQADRTHNGREALHLFTREGGTYLVWTVVNPGAVPGASLNAGSIETVSLDGDTITITGTAYLNEAMDPDFYNIDEALPASAQFHPFTLRVTCHSS